MESKDYIPEKILTKKDLNKMILRSFFMQIGFNYERMQGYGWMYSILPGLKKIYKDKEELSIAMAEHSMFFASHPFLITFIQGVIISMEESRQDRETINGIKVSIMGPLGGIGDALCWLTLLPITAGIGASLAQSGSVFGPILFLVVFNTVHLLLRFTLMNYGYKMGTGAAIVLKQNTKKISRAATIVGMCVVGALISTYVNFTIPLQFEVGQSTFNLQTDLFDKIMPALLPLLYTFGCYALLKKKSVSPIVLILITLVIGLVFALLGIYKYIPQTV